MRIMKVAFPSVSHQQSNDLAEGSTGTGHSSKQAAEEAARAAAEAQQQGNQRAIMRQLPEEDKKKIQEQIDVFKVKRCKTSPTLLTLCL